MGFTEKYYSKEEHLKSEDKGAKTPLKSLDENKSGKTAVKTVLGTPGTPKSSSNFQPAAAQQPDQPILKSPMMQIKQLIKALSSPFFDGRILLNVDSTRSTLKFILLNPSECFKEIVADARSIILAGGTMKPVRSEITFSFFFEFRQQKMDLVAI